MLRTHETASTLILASMVAAVLAAGCTTEDDSHGPLDDFGTYEAFAPETRAVDNNGNLSVSSVQGNIGCGLAQSFDAVPGTAGQQVFGNFNLSVSSFSCDGTYSVISTRCVPPEPEPPSDGDGDGPGDDGISIGDGAGSNMPYDCAIYRRWDELGELTANVYARGGAVTLSPRPSGCNVQVDLTFPGGSFSDSFTLADDSDCLQ